VTETMLARLWRSRQELAYSRSLPRSPTRDTAVRTLVPHTKLGIRTILWPPTQEPIVT